MIRAFQWDLGRQVERLDFLLRWLPRYAEWGYQELYLHLEDAIEFPSVPGVARQDAFSQRQFARLVAAATAAGIRVVPIVNLLGHTQYLVKVPDLRDLNELRDEHDRPLERGQICPLHPRTLEVAARLLRDVAPFCTAGKVHVGLDESFHLGKCPRCREEVARLRLAGHFAGHVRRLHGLTRSLGLRLGLWADMLALLPAAIRQLPRDVIAYDWYYYPFRKLPRVESHNFTEVDLAAPLRAHGVEYWGCPMNGAFRHEPMPIFGDRIANILSWWRRCRRVGAAGLLVTSWEPNRLAIELTTAVDAAAACLWLDPGVDDPAEMLARGFKRVFGEATVRSRRLAAAALASDTCAFAGGHRWQINDRWDVSADRDGPPPYEKELRVIEAAHRKTAEAGPGALTASLAFRRYLARRDVFVRRAALAVFVLRRHLARGSPFPVGPYPRPFWRKHRALLARLNTETLAFANALPAGRSAAQMMWRRSRDQRTRGPNEAMLRRDRERWRAWCRWLRRVREQPDLVWRDTPVAGSWQLQFTLHNFAPALQQVSLEQWSSTGSWRTLHTFSTIEFRTFAARPRTSIRREYSVPVDLPPHSAIAKSGNPGGFGVRLRFTVRGVGQVEVARVVLTDGFTSLRSMRGRDLVVIGRPAPRRGFPQVSRSASVEFRFRL